jgi:hypothetical protein
MERRVNVHHKRAVALLLAVAIGDVCIGLLLGRAEHTGAWHGLYCSVGLTTTEGCDLPFHGWPTYTLATLAIIFMVPLWSAIFSLFATGLVADHIDKRAGSDG